MKKVFYLNKVFCRKQSFLYLQFYLYCIGKNVNEQMSLVMRKLFFFAYAKTKTQISFAVTAKLISAFVFASQTGLGPITLKSN